jgi:hypothetical protein
MSDIDDKSRGLVQAPPVSVEAAAELLKTFVVDVQDQLKVVDLTLTTVQDMTPAAADAIKKVSENTYVIPAREQTRRAWLLTGRHYGSIAAVVVLVWLILPKIAEPLVIAGLVALALVIAAVLRAIKMFRGGGGD